MEKFKDMIDARGAWHDLVRNRKATALDWQQYAGALLDLATRQESLLTEEVLAIRADLEALKGRCL